MKRFIPFLALVAVVAMVGCSGDSPSAKPVPTVVPSAWKVDSLTASDYETYLGSPVQIDVQVSRDGAPAPDGTVVKFSSAGPGQFFGFTNHFVTKDLSKGQIVLQEDVSVVSENGKAGVFFFADWLKREIDGAPDPQQGENPQGSYTIQAQVENSSLERIQITYRAFSADQEFFLVSVNPDRGSYTGGQVVTLYGVNVSAPAEVFFIVNGRPYEAEVGTVIEGIDGWIQVATPPFIGQDWSIEQTADVQVIVGVGTENQQTDTLFGAYTLLPQSQTSGPVIFGVSPNTGRSSGGEIVNILGQGFTFPAANTVVSFIDPGGFTLPAPILSIAPDGSQIQVETPRFSTLPLESDAPQDVVVTTPNGAGRLEDGFIVLADEPQPTINSVSPTSGPLDGGTLVTIFGNGFQVPMQVWFGDLTALDVNVFNDTTPADNDRITCVTPNYSQQEDVPPVTVNVTVTNMTSGKTDTLGAAFTFGDVLFISGNTPSEGGLGDLVIIFGSGFEDPLQVFLNNEQMEVVSVSGTELVVRIPDDLGTLCSATTGEFTVVLLETNQETTGGSFTIRGNTPTVLSVTPVILQETGTTPSGLSPNAITITGQHFAEEVLVSVGTYVVPSGDVPSVSDTTIEVVSLPGPDDLGVIFDTSACTTSIGQAGLRQAATPVSVSVTNFPGDCADTLPGAIVIEPFDQTCVVAAGISLSTLVFPPMEAPTPPSTSSDTLIITETTGSSDLVVTSLNLTGRFFFDALCTNQSDPGFTVFAGSSDNSIQVFFCPNVDNGATYFGGLLVLSNSPSSPTTQSLNGQEAFPILGVSPPSLSFLTSPSTQPFTISNTGTGDLSWTAVALGTNFAITSATSGTVTAGNTTSVNVQYSGGSPSTSTGSVTVTATESDAQGSPATVTLSANVP